ncbi:MAG: hypothetical protein DELT_02518 [Desulfovibrio sp.]
MEAFSVFTVMSLTDLLSGPLGKIREGLAGAEGEVASLSDRMGKLALAMAPVAIAAGVLLGAFLSCATSAMAFESAMADVAKVIEFDSQEEFRAMNNTVKELAGRLPMAADGIAAIISAAGQSGVAKSDLAEFAEQAAKMGIAFDLTGDQAGGMMANWRAGMKLSLPQVYSLADAVNHLSNSLNATAPALGEVLQRVGALGMASGLTETQVAALGSALLSAGASPEIVSTAMRNMLSTLVQGEAMSKRSADAFKSLGFNVGQMAKDMQTDAQGTIFKVLQAIADKPKELQLSLLSEMFGESALSAIAPLLGNMDNLSKAFELVGDSAAYAGSMQAEFEARSATTENALQLLRNKLTNLSISVGTIFLPAITWGAEALGFFADALRFVVDSPFGQWLIKLLAVLSAAVIGVTAFSTAVWGVGKIAPVVMKALAPLKAAILGLGWPILLVIAAIAALYIAYKTNFGGIADTLNRWWNNIKLVFKGVTAIFKSLTGSSFELRGELAREIKAAGLEGLVVNVAKVVFRIKEFFRGVWDGIDFSRPLKILEPVGAKIGVIFDKLGNIFARVFGGEVDSASSSFYNFGQIVGGVITFGLEALATVLNVVANGINIVISAVEFIVALFTGDWQGACQAASDIWDSLVDNLMSIADLFRIGDWLREKWADVTNFLSSIDLFESGAAILNTLKEGIMSKWQDLKDSISGAFSKIRDLLPFSDAKEGPLSQLTLNGSKIMTTLAEGVEGGVGTLQGKISGALQGVTQKVGDWWDSLFNDKPIQDLAPEIAPPPVYSREPDAEAQRRSQESENRGNTYTFHIGQIVLPNAKDGQGFLESLENLVAEYGGGIEPA